MDEARRVAELSCMLAVLPSEETWETARADTKAWLHASDVGRNSLDQALRAQGYSRDHGAFAQAERAGEEAAWTEHHMSAAAKTLTHGRGAHR